MVNKPHLLVRQLRFSRHELMRCIEGITPEEAEKRMGQMNSISWIVGHLGGQEHGLWVTSQGRSVAPELAACGYGKPPSTPPLEKVLVAWRRTTAAADEFLDTLTPEKMTEYLEGEGWRSAENIGTLLMRNIMHYWFHLGEAHAIRQIMGHQNLPDFVGNMSACVYEPE